MQFLLLGLLSIAVLIVSAVPSFANAQSVGRLSEQINLYLIPWQWTEIQDETGEVIESYWGVKYPALGSIDLRTIPQMATPGGVEQCCALISTLDEISESDVTFIAHGVNGTVTDFESVSNRLRLRMSVIDSTMRADRLLSELLTAHSDPSGQLAWKPLIPDSNGTIEAWIAPEVRLFLDSISRDSIAWVKAMEVHQLDYDIIRRDSGIDVARKVAGYWLLKYGEDVRTVEQQRDGISNPTTSVGDTFNRADNVNINASDTGKTLDGVPATWQWVELVTGFDIASNRLQTNTTAVNADAIARVEQDLSSENIYSEIIQVNATGNISAASPAVRFDPTDITFYTCIKRSTLSQYIWGKYIAGVPTFANIGPNETTSSPALIGCQIDDDTLTGYHDSILKFTVTDTAITGFLRSGVRFRHGSSQLVQGDDFFSEDVPIPESHRIFITPH
jgi:hypothetical protein